jgi:predicted permease
LLLVSWLQVGALFVTRLASGGGEVSLRVALGASRLRVLRSFLIEAGLISGAAVAIAALVMPLAGAAMTTLLPPEIASGRRFDTDVRTLLFVGAAAVAGALLMSAITVDIVRRSHPATALRAGTSAARAPAAGRVRAAILLTQVGLTTVLLYMTGLAVHSFVRITAVDDGIDAQGLLAWEIPLTVESRAARQVRLDDVMSQLNAVPGVRATAASAWRPLRAPRFETPVVLSDLAGRPTVTSRYNFVTEEFFQTLGMTIVEGASPDRLGDAEAGRTAVINAALAERIRVHGPIVGREIELPAFEFRGRVVGVVANHLEQTSEEPPHPVVFLRHPTEGQRWWLLQVFVRTADPAGAATGSARIVRDVWGAGATTTVTFMTAEVSRAQSHWRARVLLLSLVAGLCVPLSLVGLAGALGRDVAERKYEVAVRLALGAEASRIRGAVVRRAVSLVGLGLAIGLGGGWAVGRLMDSYLFGVRAADAATMAGVAGVLLVCAWLAALGPAWRASRVDPALTLKEM